MQLAVSKMEARPFSHQFSVFWFRFTVNISSVFQRFFSWLLREISVRFSTFISPFLLASWSMARAINLQSISDRFGAIFSGFETDFQLWTITNWNLKLLMSNVWLVFSQNLVSLSIIFIFDFDWFSVGVEQIDGELRLKMNRVRIGFDCLNDDLLRRQFLNVVSRRLVQYLVVASVVSHRTMTLEFIELIF